jgi:hypothetical protein
MAHWEMATTDQMTIWMGIHRSGPIFLDTSCDGSSARRKATRKMTLP